MFALKKRTARAIIAIMDQYKAEARKVQGRANLDEPNGERLFKAMQHRVNLVNDIQDEIKEKYKI